jgi:hypothetical protein
MARRPTKPAANVQRANLSIDDMKKGIIRLERRCEALKAFDPSSIIERYDPSISVLEKSIDQALGDIRNWYDRVSTME